MQSTQAQTLFDVVLVDNLIRVLIDQASGEVLGVQCAKTGCAAEFLFSRKQIADAVACARNAWQSTSDCYA